MMNGLWAGMMILACATACITGRTAELSAAVTQGTEQAVTLCLALVGVMGLWSGILELMQKSGICKGLTVLLRPILCPLFPRASQDTEAMEGIAANVTANLMGLSNAATPIGLRAGKRLYGLYGAAGTPDEVLTFVVLNTTSIQLIPTTVAAVRAALGAAQPFDIMFLPLLLACTAGYALYRRVDLFPTLLCGVEKGLHTALHILPTMIVILTAVRMLRVSGFVDLMGQACRPLLQLTGIPEECTALLLLKPISGSGGLALGQDIMRTCGVDSVQGRTAAVMLGASETSLYTISVYCGYLGLKKTRYAIPAALLADFAAFVCAAWFVRILY